MMNTKLDLGRPSLFLALALSAAACGEDGMDGTAGPRGPAGPAGPAGMDGANGTNGTDGASGSNALAIQTRVGASPECPTGGVRVDTGVDDDGDGMLAMSEVDATQLICSGGEPFTLQLLHFADVDGNEATALDAVDELSALVDGFQRDPIFGPATLLVSSGDNLIPGPRYFAAENNAVRALTGSNEPGHVDHYFMNQMGVAASALGNHDLDQGPGELADALQRETRGDAVFPGTTFPYLAANVDFSGESDLRVGTDGEDHRLLGGRVAGSAIYRIGADVIGLVGVATPDLSSITTTGRLTIAGSTMNIAELATAVQPTIDALTMAGVDKIVVLAHLQQIQLEKALAAQLRDVDIIVAGGSNTRMGDMTDALFPNDMPFSEPYPFQAMDAGGNPTLIVNVDGDYKYLGRLVVSFDEQGVILPFTVDAEVSGAWAATPENVLRAGGGANPNVVTVRDEVQRVIRQQYENVIGHTDVFLEGRRGVVRTQETNLGNLTADSMKWYAERCTELSGRSVVALKNGGGIRAEIGDAVVDGVTTTLNPPFNNGLMVAPGDVSEGHFRGTLRFDNGLVAVDVTGVELKTLLEHGVRRFAPGATNGEFPQVAGIAFGFDPTGTAQVSDANGVTTPGARVTDLYVDTTGNGTPDTALYRAGVAQAAASQTYTVVTLNFLANGGDSYPYSTLAAANRRQLYGTVGFGDPDANNDDMPDFPVLTGCDPGRQSGFSATGQEQDALAEYFLQFYPSQMMPFTTAETPPADDRRIQDLSVIPAFVAP